MRWLTGSTSATVLIQPASMIRRGDASMRARDAASGPGPAAERAKLVKAAGWASVATALAILGVKSAAWWLSGSPSVLAALADSGMDLLSSSINLLALSYAAMPPDNEHRYGHGKAEALAAFLQGLLLCATSVAIIWHAASLVGSTPTRDAIPHTSALVMAASLLFTIGLVAFQRYVVRRTGSNLVAADSMHYRSDFLINGSVIAVLLVGPRWSWLDPLLAVLIGLYILGAAARILGRAVNELLDRELVEEVDSELLSLAARHPKVLGVHGLRTRQSGGRRFAQFDLDFPAEMPLVEAHQAATEVRLDIEARFPAIDVQIHFDAVER